MPLTDLTFLDPGSSWPPPSEAERLKRYAENRLLWKGEHDKVYGDWWRVLREDKKASLELVFSWHRRLSKLWADLLIGEPPSFTAGQAKSKEQDAIDAITKRSENGFVVTCYEVALDISRYGDGIMKVTLEEEGPEIWGQPPSYWFPVVRPDNLRRFTQHVLAWDFEVTDPPPLPGMNPKKTRYLFAEIHERGRVNCRLYRMDSDKIKERVRGEAFSAMIPDRSEVQETRIDDFLVVPFTGMRATDEMFGVDDYVDLDSIVQALETRAGQINRILDKHSDPSMYGPEDFQELDPKTGQAQFTAGGAYFPVEEDGNPPGYVTWEGHLESQFRELEFLIEQLYVISETSPAAFGQLKAGLAESGSALKRLMIAPLAKVARIRMRFDPSARQVIRIASQLAAANGRGTPVLEDITIHWKDGLPQDDTEQTTIEVTRVGAGISSKASAIRRLDDTDEEAVEKELERIEEEQKRETEAMTPPQLAGFSTSSTGDPPDDQEPEEEEEPEDPEAA